MAAENSILSAGQIIFAIIYILIVPTLVLLLSGDWLWVEGWIFSVWLIIISVSTVIYLYRKDPELLRERFKQPGTDNQKVWDKYFLYGFKLLFLAWLVIMPIDAKRYEWTINFPLWLKVLGVIELLISFFFLYRSFIVRENFDIELRKAQIAIETQDFESAWIALQRAHILGQPEP